MEFEVQSSIWISDDDLDEMARQVKTGAKFDDIYDEIMAGYDDVDYYNRHSIKKEVAEEVQKRLTL